MSDLTRRQRQIVDYIRDCQARSHYSPSLREIGQAVGLTSSSSVAHQLDALEGKRYLTRQPNTPRTLVLTESGHSPVQVEMGKVESVRSFLDWFASNVAYNGAPGLPDKPYDGQTLYNEFVNQALNDAHAEYLKIVLAEALSDIAEAIGPDAETPHFTVD